MSKLLYIAHDNCYIQFLTTKRCKGRYEEVKKHSQNKEMSSSVCAINLTTRVQAAALHMLGCRSSLPPFLVRSMFCTPIYFKIYLF